MTADPESIGRYRIEAVLGRGAMGVIYRAHDPDIDRQVAIKLIRADLLDGADRVDYLARFRREAQAAGRCAHPNIVTIYDFAMHGENPFLAMEFVDGINLVQAREQGRQLPPGAAADVILQVLAALQAAHVMGIVHRDIKPANILLLDGNRVKVTDFGISRFNSSEMTQDGAVIGTPSYMSPEQCRGGAVDARSDLFSAGAVLYELLAGERPFPGRTFSEVMQRLLYEPPRDFAAGDSGILSALQAVVLRALAKQPAERFASAGDMSAALQAAMSIPHPSAGAPDDRTVYVAPPADVAAADDATRMSLLGRALAHYVGPIASYLVQSAIRRADQDEALCDLLASHIEKPQDRDRFRAEALRQLRGAATTASGIRDASNAGRQGFSLSPAELDRAQVALARTLGPLARIMVKRAAAEARSQADFWEILARHIDAEADRRAFLNEGKGLLF